MEAVLLQQLAALRARQKDLDRAEILIATELVFRANGRSDVACSQRELARSTGLAQKSVWLALRGLEGKDLILSSLGKANAAGIYRLNLGGSQVPPGPDGSAPSPRLNGDGYRPSPSDGSAPSPDGSAPSLHKSSSRARVHPPTYISKDSESVEGGWSDGAASQARRELEEVQTALYRSFGHHVAARDPLLRRFRSLAREHAIAPAVLAEYLGWLAHKKRGYPITSAGAVWEFAREGSSSFGRWLKQRRPPRREESSPSLSPAEEIAALEGFLRELPEHPQAAICRARLDELRGKNGARAAAGAS